MEAVKEIKYHSSMLKIIDSFKNPKWGKLFSNSSSYLNEVKAYFRPDKTEFSIDFKYDIFSKKKKNLDVGQSHNNIQIKFKDSPYILEKVFLGVHSPPKFKGFVDRIHTKGYPEKKQYYYRLVIPLEKELNFHNYLEQASFTSDLGFRSRCLSKAIINGESIEIYCINTKREKFFLIVDSPIKQNFDEFSKKANALIIGLGYLSGHYAGNQGYFFGYSKRDKKEPKHFRFIQLRNTIKSGYTPINSNSHSYLHGNKLAKKYYPLLRPMSIKEFSLLAERIHNSLDFASALMFILELSIASLLSMPGGLAIALETMSDLIIGKLKFKISPIKDKKLSQSIRQEFKTIIDKHKSLILPDDLKTLYIRIEQFNQITNKARLKTPFEILGISLNEEDLRILETRNDFLHGRFPDLTNAGRDRSIERINKDIYYAAMRFYTLLNMLILKWIGYDNRVINFPKIYETYTQIKVKEEPFRLV